MAASGPNLTRGGTIPLPASSGAVVDASNYALAAVLRFAVDTVAGVRAHRCRIVADPEAPHTVRVWMSVSLRYGSGSIAALELAQRRVAAALTDRIGLSLGGLDFEVADVWIDEVLDDRPGNGRAAGTGQAAAVGAMVARAVTEAVPAVSGVAVGEVRVHIVEVEVDLD